MIGRCRTILSLSPTSFIAACALFVTIGIGSAYAQESVFVVARVPVQATADTATAAKELAQDTGRRKAMDILLRRLTPEEDWRYLPSLANAEPAAALSAPDGVKQAIDINGQQLVALEQSFEVYGEKSSSRIYRAYITYRFKPDAIRRLLKAASLPYSEAQTRTALVLPVLQTDSGAYLWEPNNPWMAAWKSRPYTHELTPFVAPNGDVEDEATITAQGALDLDPDAAAALAGRYGVSQVVVAHARLRQVDGQDRLSVRLLIAYSEAASSGTLPSGEEDILAAIEPTAARHSSDIYGYAGSRNNDFAADVGQEIAAASGVEQSGNFPILAERLIEDAIAKYASGWKERTLIDHASDAFLAATAFFDGLKDWARIRGALVETPLVGAVQISALSPTGAEMGVRVFGDPSRLTTALENQGIVFWTETGDHWFLATPDVATSVRGQRFLKNQSRRRLFGESAAGVEGDGYAPSYGEMEATPASILQYEDQ